MSIWQVAALAIVVCAASAMQASIGFGMGMLAAPLVALIDPLLIPGLLIMSATVVTLMVVVSERQALDLPGAGWALAGRIPGTIAGTALLLWLPESGLAVLVAVVVLFGVVCTGLGWRPPPIRRNMVAAGAASGMFATATSIGGPPMALVMQGTDGPRLRGTMSAFFLVGSVMSIAALAASGRIDGPIVIAFVLLIPATVAGYLVSRYLNRAMSTDRLRTVSIVVSCLGALILLGQQLG